MPTTDTYIEKDSAINDEIDRLRHSATRSILERDDVIVISSVSCIYGIGSPAEYYDQKIVIFEGEEVNKDDFLKKLINIQYDRNDDDFGRGDFRTRGDIVEIFLHMKSLISLELSFLIMRLIQLVLLTHIPERSLKIFLR